MRIAATVCGPLRLATSPSRSATGSRSSTTVGLAVRQQPRTRSRTGWAPRRFAAQVGRVLIDSTSPSSQVT
jgi:hypothetical protein